MARVVGLVTFICDDLDEWMMVEDEVMAAAIVKCTDECSEKDLRHVCDFGE